MEKGQHPLARARAAAEALVEVLRPYCRRIEIAGSIRRGKPVVGDVEIVACAATVQTPVPGDLFGRTFERDALSAALAAVSRREPTAEACELWFGRPAPLYGERAPAWGPRYKRLQLVYRSVHFAVDLFIVRPESFGSQLAIRTGPADFSKLLVAARAQGGAAPHGLVHAGGRVHRHGLPLCLPEESDYFAALGVPLWDPHLRTAARLQAFLNSASPSP